MSLALQTFLGNNLMLKKIQQKFSEPGHGDVKEINTAHSILEKHIRHLDICSPLSLTKILLAIPQGQCKFKIVQVQSSDYFNCEVSAKKLHYKTVPYTQVKSLIYKQYQYFNIYYKKYFIEKLETCAKVCKPNVLSDIPLPPKLGTGIWKDANDRGSSALFHVSHNA